MGRKRCAGCGGLCLESESRCWACGGMAFIPAAQPAVDPDRTVGWDPAPARTQALAVSEPTPRGFGPGAAIVFVLLVGALSFGIGRASRIHPAPPQAVQAPPPALVLPAPPPAGS